MDNEKKSFVLYLDAYPVVCNLPVEQRGLLMSELFRYAAIVRERTMDPVVAMGQCSPDMTPETRMAFCFMAASILRDTEKWKEHKKKLQDNAARRAESRQRLAAMPLNRPGVSVYPSEEEYRAINED